MNRRERRAIRALLVSPGAEILLMQLDLPDPPRSVWIAPGGGLKTGEDAEACLRRELHEETGLIDLTLGPEVWVRSHTFEFASTQLTQHERYFLVRTDRFEPTTDQMPDEVESRLFRAFRWWRPQEIRNSPEIFAPRRLGTLLQHLLDQGPPPAPVDVGP